jgi:hypothetical protein
MSETAVIAAGIATVPPDDKKVAKPAAVAHRHAPR